jgi:hypothetical protein
MYINFGFVMMTLIVVWEGQVGNMHFDRPSLWLMQAGINFTQTEVVTLEEASFLLLGNPKCPLVN